MPALGFHILIVTSELDAKLPFDNLANLANLSYVSCQWIVLESHILIVSYHEPNAKLPLDNVTNEVTIFVCPVNV